MKQQNYVIRNDTDLENLCYQICKPATEAALKNSKVYQHVYPNPPAEKGQIDLHKEFNKIKRIVGKETSESINVEEISDMVYSNFYGFCSWNSIEARHVEVEKQILTYEIQPEIDKKYPKLDMLYHILKHNQIGVDRTLGEGIIYVYDQGHDNSELMQITLDKSNKIKLTLGGDHWCMEEPLNKGDKIENYYLSASTVTSTETMDYLIKILSIVRGFIQ